MKNKYDAIIIGGGIIGASVLYHLTKKGIKNILLLEKGELGAGTTAYTAAWIRLQEPTEIQIRLSQLSFPEFHEFEHEFKIGLQIKGSLVANTAEYIDKEKQCAELQASLGLSVQLLTPSEIKTYAPILNTEDISIGRYCAEDGLIDAQALIRAYIRLAKSAGAAVEEGTEAIDVIVENNQVVAVKTPSETISTPLVINAAGIYASQVGSWVGANIPIRKRLGHIVFTEPIASIPDDMPLVEVSNPELFFIGASGKHADYTIGDSDTDGFEHEPQLDLLIEQNLDALIHRSPDIANAGVIDCIAGIKAHSPDGLPILGPVEGVSGFVNCCGLGSNGVVYSPAVGELVSRYIVHDDLPFDIAPLYLKRFEK